MMASFRIHSSVAHWSDELIGFHVVRHTIGRIRAHVRGGGLRRDEVAGDVIEVAAAQGARQRASLGAALQLHRAVVWRTLCLQCCEGEQSAFDTRHTTHDTRLPLYR